MVRARMGGAAAGQCSRKKGKWWVAGPTALACIALAGNATAQQNTFHLDRLEIPGGPDDGLVLFRPVTNENPIFFAQGALGYSLNPLRTRNITVDQPTLRQSSNAAIQHQVTTYATAGFEFLDRVILAATLPVTWVEAGQQPNYAQTFLNSS